LVNEYLSVPASIEAILSPCIVTVRVVETKAIFSITATFCTLLSSHIITVPLDRISSIEVLAVVVHVNLVVAVLVGVVIAVQ